MLQNISPTKRAVGRRSGRRTRDAWLLLGAIALMMTPALFDIEPVAQATRDLEHTRDAVFGVISVLLTAGLVSAWAKRRADRRDRARFDGVSGVAFRSLAQAANDAGRMLLAPVVGADLHAAGIPGFTPQHHATNLELLRSASIDADFRPRSGVWDDDVDRAKIRENLAALCQQPGFAPLMFRTTSAARRRLQEAMADWAPVMVTVPGIYEHLGTGWLLADRIVALLEAWRALCEADATHGESASAVNRVQSEYLETIRLYQRWIAELVPLSRLPIPPEPTRPS